MPGYKPSWDGKNCGSIRASAEESRGSIYHQVFGSVLLDGGLAPRKSTFDELAEAANRTLKSFDACCLSNLAYACALFGV